MSSEPACSDHVPITFDRRRRLAVHHDMLSRKLTNVAGSFDLAEAIRETMSVVAAKLGGVKTITSRSPSSGTNSSADFETRIQHERAIGDEHHLGIGRYLADHLRNAEGPRRCGNMFERGGNVGEPRGVAFQHRVGVPHHERVESAARPCEARCGHRFYRVDGPISSVPISMRVGPTGSLGMLKLRGNHVGRAVGNNRDLSPFRV